MLIKEYRILLPMTVQEYRIAQLYMIQVSGFWRLKGNSEENASRTLNYKIFEIFQFSTIFFIISKNFHEF